MYTTTHNLMFLFLAGAATALACGLGAVPVFLLGNRLGSWRPALRGVAAGLMIVASVEGLLRPALRSGGVDETLLGLAAGVIFLFLMHRLVNGYNLQLGRLRGAGMRHFLLVFAVLFIHSLPEGMAMGAAHASEIKQLNVFVLAAIALQNIPEGAVVAIPMVRAGFGRLAQFWTAVLTSVPQPIGAPLAYLLVDRIEQLLPTSLAFAGGAMLGVVVLELIPSAFLGGNWAKGLVGVLAGAAVMLALSAALGV